MKDLRRRFERFCFANRNKGIPNLMLYIVLGSALLYLISMVTDNYLLYYLLRFDRQAILNGQIWRLITYPLTFGYSYNMFMLLIACLCFFSLGRAIENIWGTLRFNLFYLCGIVMMDVYCMIFGGSADAGYLNTSLFLAYATMFPDAQFLLFFIIPIKARILGLLDLVLVIIGLITYPFPNNFFSVISLANYFLFFGKDVLNLIPVSWRANFSRLTKQTRRKSPSKSGSGGPKVIPFPSAGSYEATVAKPKAPYTHRCTVCGRTDTDFPDLEFRYCSRCKGYHCYCEDHISNHAHIQ